MHRAGLPLAPVRSAAGTLAAVAAPVGLEVHLSTRGLLWTLVKQLAVAPLVVTLVGNIVHGWPWLPEAVTFL